MIPRLAVALLACAQLVPAALANDPDALDASIVLRAGDTIPDVGLVTLVRGIGLDDHGNWYAEVDTDVPNVDLDEVIVVNGVAAIREGDDVPEPMGAVVDQFIELDGSVTDTGNIGWVVELAGGGLTSADDSAVYWGASQLFRTGALLAEAGAPAGTFWTSFLEAKANESRQLLLVGSVDDPLQGVVRVMTQIQVAPGGDFSQQVVAYTGAAPAGVGEVIEELETGLHEFALSDGGHTIFGARLDAAPGNDGVIVHDGVVVAREGTPSPIPGRDWQVLSNAQVDANAAGDYVLTGYLDGTNSDDGVILLNDEVVVREGQVLPAISPFVITALRSPTIFSPIHLGENRNVLWMGRWNDPSKPLVRGLFLNDRLLVEEGATVIDGELIESFEPGEGGHALSDDGETVLLRCRIDGGQHAVVRIEIGPWVSLGQGLAGSGGLVPCLVGNGSLVEGEPFSLHLANGLPSAFATLVVGFGELGVLFKGGVMVPQLDLLFNLPLNASGERVLAGPLPAGAPSGLPLYCQFWVQDAGGPAGFAASNAVLGTVP